MQASERFEQSSKELAARKGESIQTRTEKTRKAREKREEKAQHRAFPRGPPPQYYPGSNLLNFAVRIGSGEPALWPR